LQTVIERINHPDAERQVAAFDTKLIVRESTASIS
jgi:DNA-binding LacI/PurR family transcriptional regulator